MAVAPTTSAEFDRAYQMPLTIWGDIRIPPEIKRLAQVGNPQCSLELGCGIGRLTRYMARQGLQATGVDFSAVAITQAKARLEQENLSAKFLVGDVTNLAQLTGPFDISYDVGCFHCLNAEGQQKYVAEVGRLLKPGGTHLIWALDHTPSDMQFSPALVEQIFAPAFTLQNAQKNRRRLVASHWYWLARKSA